MAMSEVKVARELSLQVMSDAWLAWQLQAEEYKKYYQLTPVSMSSVFLSPQSSTSPLYQFQNTQGETVSFNLRSTSINGDCFFAAVNKSDFTRNTLVKKLLDNPTEPIRTIFAHEIRQFLYLGYTGSHPNKQEDGACQRLLTSNIRQFFLGLQEVEAAFRPKVDEARSTLGARETHQKQPPELLDLLKKKKPHLAQKFEEAYQAVLNADKAIYEYCCETEVFKNYVTLYLKEARGYIPFSRDFGRETPTTTIDVINQLFGLKIQVYLPSNRNRTDLQLANQLQTGEVIPIFHNGINHFWGLIVSSHSANIREVKRDDLEKEENDLNPACQSSDTPGDVVIHLSPLPNIPYNREELNEIIEEIPMGPDIQIKVSSYLENIERQVSTIQKYQAKKKPENFYESIRSATNEIRNTAKALYELTKPYHLNLPNTLKELLLKWIIPLEAALEKRLEMPVDDREALVLKTKHLYAEQSLVSRQPALQQALIEHLGKVQALLLEFNRPNPRCYISYAWPSKENKAQEYWVQPFLYVLYDHLTAAGIRVVMDIRDNKPSDSIYRFMEQYHEGNYIILVGTESLLQKHYAVIPHAVQTELSIISNRSERDQRQFGQSRIYPMLISGTLKTAYPERYQLYSTVRDARERGYLGTLKKLTDWIYDDRVKVEKHKHANLWRTFNEACPGLESKAVKEEIAIGYHRQRLDYLKQDVQYQSVEAQEKTQHSQAVEAEQISALIKSQGINPQTLFDEHGQQFQRPYSNPDFIERKALWEKMTQHFAQSEQQILTLTAHGLGGMGKTELAGYYYLHPLRPYTLRAWFNGSSREGIYLQYIELALSNGIQFLEDMPTEDKIKRVKVWLESQKDCLLVYDNVSALHVVEGLLPERGKHHILITSRNEVDWSAHQKLDVDIMEEEEAIALIRKITGRQENEDLLKQLVKTLGYLPLALAQAGAYMSVKSLDVGGYLELYQRHQAKFLTDKTPRTPKHEPVWITFDMNLKALELDCSPALNTLKQASWLNSAAIPEIMLFLMINKNTEDKHLMWGDIKDHIKRYSLMRIDVAEHQLSMHPLLQDIIRSKQMPEDQLQQFRECSEILNVLEQPCYQYNFIAYKILLPHAERLHAHAKAIAINATDDKIRDFLLVEPDCLRMFYLRLGLTEPALTFLTQVISTYERHYGKDHVRMTAVLGNLGTAYLNQGKLEQAREQSEQALRIQEGHYGKDHVETVAVLVNLGSVYLKQGKLEEAREHYGWALKIQECHYGKDYIDTAATLGNLGNVYFQQGEFEQAREYYERALSIQEYYYHKDHIEMAALLVSLGNIYCKQGKLEQAKQNFERALTIQESHYGKGHVQTTASLGSLGTIYSMQGKFEPSRKCYERVLKIQESHYGKDHVETTTWLENLGTVYRNQGKLEQANECYERALKIKEFHYGKDHIETAGLLENLGKTYSHQGKVEQAKEHHERALKIQESHYGKDHVETAVALVSLGNIYCKQGKLEEAREYYEWALRIEEGHYGKDHVETTAALGDLGNVYKLQGKLEQAKEYYERTLRIQEQHYGKDHVGMAATLGNLGGLYLKQRRFEQAEEYCERALRIKEHHYGKDHVETGVELVILGDIYRLQGKLEQAKDYYERTLRIQEHHYGEDHVETTGVLGNLGDLYLEQCRFEQAKEYCERALRIKEHHYGKDHAETAVELVNLGNVYRLQGKLEQAKEYYERTLRIEEHHYGKDHVETAVELAGLGNIYCKQEKLEEASEYYERALKIQEYHCGKDHVEMVTVLGGLGTVYLKQNKFEEARKYYERILRIKEDHYGKDHVETAVELAGLGNIYCKQEKLEEASEYYERALKIQESYYGKDHVEIVTVLGSLGTVYLKQDKLEEAKEHYERTLRIKEHHYGKDHVEMAMELGNLGALYLKQDKLEKAREHSERALKIKEYHYGKDHVEMATELGNLGALYLKQDKLEEASRYYEEMLRIKEYHYGKDHMEMATELGNLGALYLKQDKLEKAREYSERALKIKEYHYGKDHMETVTELVRLGTVYRKQRKLEEAREHFERVLRVQESNDGKDHIKTATALGNLGNVYCQQGKLEQANEYYERALRIQEHHFGKDHMEMVASLVGRGSVYLQRGNLAEAKEYYERALKIQQCHYGKDHAEMADVLVNLGTLYQKQDKLREASEYYEWALRIEECHYDKEHVKVATVLVDLGIVYLKQGKFEQAKECYERALKIQEHHGKERVEVAMILVNLGVVYLNQGKFEQARGYYERALKIQEQYYGKDHLQTAAVVGNLGTIYRNQGKLQQAKEYYERALRIKERHYGKDHVDTSVELVNLGNIYRRQNELKQAKDYYKQALKIQECYYGKDHVNTATSLVNLGVIYSQRGKLRQAKEYQERGLKIQELHYGKGHVRTTESLGGLGNVHLQRGNLAEAKECYEQALSIREHHYGRNHVETTIFLQNLGNIYSQQGKLEQAREYSERIVRIKESHYGRDHLEVADTLFNLAVNSIQSNQSTIARNQLQRAQNIYRQHFPEGHPTLTKIEECLQLLSSVYFNVALATGQKPEPATEHTSTIAALKSEIHQLNQEGMKHYRTQEYKEAIEFFQQALALQQQTSSTSDEETATLHFNVGSAYFFQKNYLLARTSLQSAYDMRLALLGVSHAATQKAHSRLQECQRAIEQHATSSEIKLENETAHFSTLELTTHSGLTTVGLDFHQLSQEGMKYYRTQEYKEAIELFRQALSLGQRINNIPHEEVATLHFNIGAAYFLQKNYLSARTWLQSAYDMRLALLGASHAATQKAQSRLQECQRAIEQHPALAKTELTSENKTEASTSTELETESPARSMVFSTVGGTPNNPESQPQNASANASKPKAKSNLKPSLFKREGES